MGQLQLPISSLESQDHVVELLWWHHVEEGFEVGCVLKVLDAGLNPLVGGINLVSSMIIGWHASERPNIDLAKLI